MLPLICDPRYISPTFERLAHALLGEPQSVGFFLLGGEQRKHLEPPIVYASAVVDLRCTQNRAAIEDAGFDPEESAELTLICSNKRARIPGLASSFLRAVIDRLVRIKPYVSHLFLYANNAHAAAFYRKNGFVHVSSDAAKKVMVYSL